jgi:Ring finger domain
MASPSSFLSPNFPILAIIISGILTTTLILVSFYFFITKCQLRNTSVQNTPVVPIFPLEPQGLKPSLIRAIPITKFSKSSISTIICTICLNEFHVEEKLKLLPNCSHAFHIDCIDTWLQSNTKCPLCRVSITDLILHQKQTNSITSNSERELEDEGNYFARRETFMNDKWSLGDDCIVHVRENEEDLRVHPLRRSLSLDSSNEM